MYKHRAGDPPNWIPKEQLEVGARYRGKCRNADEADWDGTGFNYIRTKFGTQFLETLPCPEDDDGFDVFFPQEKL